MLRHQTPPYRHLAVLFYPQDIFLVDLQGGGGPSAPPRSGGGGRGGPQGGQQHTVRILWHVSVPLIREIKAGAEGVTLRTAGAPTVSQRPEDALARASSAEGLSVSDAFKQGMRVAARGGELNLTFYIPCANAALVNEVYQELLEVQRGNASVIELGTERQRSETFSRRQQ